MRRLILAALLPVLAAAAAPAAAADDIVRVGTPTGAILQAAVVPAGFDTIYVSGMTPPPLNAGAPAGTPVQFGDTKTQTIGVMKRIEEVLKGQGYTMGDVVMMRVYLVGDPPARVTMLVAALVAPGMLAEIEVQAAKKK